MEATEEQESNTKGEKEHEKLLTRSNNGACSGPKYVVEPVVEPVISSSIQNLPSVERSNSYTSDTIRESLSKSPGRKSQEQIPEENSPKANCKRVILKVVVTVLFILIVLGVVAIWTAHEGRSKKTVGNEFFDFISKKRELNVYNAEDTVVLTGFLKVSDFKMEKTRKCSPEFADPSQFYCYQFDDNSVFKFFTYRKNSLNCIKIMWENLMSAAHVPMDCYDLEYGLWYGLPNYQASFWPLDINNIKFDDIPYRPGSKDILGNILENYWISTDGVVIVAQQELPLRVSMNSKNNRRLCLSLDANSLLPGRPIPNVNYSVCQGADIKSAHVAARNYFFPVSAPVQFDKHEFSKIVWSYKDENPNNNERFGGFLDKLKTANLDINMVEFDAKWQEEEGEFTYKSDIESEISVPLEGKYAGVKLMLPLSLACSYLSKNFIQSINDGLFVRDSITQGIKVIKFQGKNCGLWDATNPDTESFLTKELTSLQKSDTLHPKEFPHALKLESLISDNVYPITLFKNTTTANFMNKAFLNMLLGLSKPVLLQSAYRYQHLPVFIEIATTVVTKDNKKCLDYLIPGALTAGIHGYPWLMAEAPDDSKIDMELFMRWLQVAIFFPGVKIPKSAVNYGEETISLTQNMSDIRNDIVVPEITKMKDSIENGEAIIQPMWWINPLDYKTLKIFDQFLVGTTIMVAPVLCHGERARDVYLPEGTWTNYYTGEILEGRQWLRAYKVSLHEIPIFISVDPSNTTIADQ